jgi:hydroxymethylpyrimidine/phosphomethylpyrimidine kinase
MPRAQRGAARRPSGGSGSAASAGAAAGTRGRRAVPVVLAVGGHDPTAGAGVGADVRTLEAAGVAAAVAVTAITVQDGRHVRRVVATAPALLAAQIEAVMGALPVAAVKCGMLASPAAVRVVARALRDTAVPLVVDPVLRASGGERLAGRGVARAIAEHLLPIAAVVTPNVAEAAVLAGMRIADADDMEEAARRIVALGARAAVVKGGHLEGAPVDVLVAGRSAVRWRAARIDADMHGTGCAFASAVAAGLARKRSVRTSVEHARAHVRTLLRRAQRIGSGARLRVPPAGASLFT